METMLERVTAAVANVPIMEGTMTLGAGEDAEAIARAAIEAMRSPLLAQMRTVVAGENDIGRQAFNNGAAVAATHVAVLIDDALNPPV